MKKAIRILLMATLIAACLIPCVSAAVPYTTYTYDIDGKMTESPHAYVPDNYINSYSMGLSNDLDSPTDIVVDEDMNVYIADANNDRIVVLSPDYKVTYEIYQFINNHGVPDNLDYPNGVFVKGDEVYVADTDNKRVVVFDRKDGSFLHIVEEPDSENFPDDHVYRPIAVAVDNAGRLYIVSSSTTYGVISMNADGSFNGFLGAQKTSLSAFQIVWRTFQTKEQRQLSEQNVPTEYNNITIDASGFIYVTTNSIDPVEQQAAMTGKSTSADYAPVKKLAATGNDVMKRTGFWPPSGEVDVLTETDGISSMVGASSIIDVALGESGVWSIIDENRQRIYTYDEDGNLLYIFGDIGTQIGDFQGIKGLTYQGSKLLVLDKTSNAFTVFKRTEYGNLIADALKSNQDRHYDQATGYWEQILQRNSNLDLAYVGIGDSLFRSGDYEEAMEQYKLSNAVEKYSDAFRKYRKDWIEKYIWVIPLVIIAVAVLMSKFFKYTRKVNEKGQITKEKRTAWEAFIYGFHVIFHPFDGFWDLKHEKRGNLKGAMIILALTVLTFMYSISGTGYIFNSEGTAMGIVGMAVSVLVPVVLWCVANWCLTTLFDGEGNFRDIVITTCYSLLPMILLLIPSTLLSLVFTNEEVAILTVLNSFAYIWTGFLLFFGTMVVHDYSMLKNILITVFTIVGMVIIIFICILFSSLFTKIWSFIYGIYVEISYRV